MSIPAGEIRDVALDVISEGGLVIAEDAALAVTMTADCADETGRRLMAAARDAREAHEQAPRSGI